MKKGHLIKSIDAGSIAEELGLEPGDRVMTIDGQELEDIFDYQYYINSEAILMVVMKANGEEWELEIENDYEDLGITFENGLMSEYRSCRNKCIFCFIDQMPKNMRETLYYKDDDFRLSLIYGNYITMTNLSDDDIDRIIRLRISPLNLSVHTTNPELRVKMMANPRAAKINENLQKIFAAGLNMRCQIVLCKGINDGKELDRSLSDLKNYYPSVSSVSVVPVGLTKFREGLFPLEPFEKDDAKKVIEQIRFTAPANAGDNLNESVVLSFYQFV